MTELESTLERLALELRDSAAGLRQSVELLQRAEEADARAAGRAPREAPRDDIAARGGDAR